MSMERNYYVIAGYDLTGQETEKFCDWKYTEDGEKYFCYQFKEKIQLFDDPMDGSHLFLGYILAANDEYDFETTSFDLSDSTECSKCVYSELQKLQEMGVISKATYSKPVFKVIVFEECR